MGATSTKILDAVLLVRASFLANEAAVNLEQLSWRPKTCSDDVCSNTYCGIRLLQGPGAAVHELRRLIDNKGNKRRTSQDRHMSKAIISAINKQCLPFHTLVYNPII